MFPFYISLFVSTVNVSLMLFVVLFCVYFQHQDLSGREKGGGRERESVCVCERERERWRKIAMKGRERARGELATVVEL